MAANRARRTLRLLRLYDHGGDRGYGDLMAWQTRKKLLRKIEKTQSSRAILYVTGDRPGQETAVSADVIDHFVEHLDDIGVCKRISLILYTRGGDGMAAWSLINLIRMFCDELEVIVPVKALSAGTMMAIGADNIVMTKQATLGPIDPSINHPLAPQVMGAPVGTRAPVSVEAIRGYLDLAKETVSRDALSAIMNLLSSQVHPLVLGEVNRRRQQIQQLAEKLLKPQVKKAEDRKKVISFLCSDSGSHDYTLNRREASALGLTVSKCSPDLYKLVKKLHKDFADEMKLREPFNGAVFPQNAITQFTNVRALVESTGSKAVQFVSEGTAQRHVQPPLGDQTSIAVTWEGWRLAA